MNPLLFKPIISPDPFYKPQVAHHEGVGHAAFILVAVRRAIFLIAVFFKDDYFEVYPLRHSFGWGRTLMTLLLNCLHGNTISAFSDNKFIQI